MIGGDSIRVVHPLFQAGDSGSTPTSPLQFNIAECSVKTACALNALWHSRFPRIDESNVIRNRRAVCFAADFDGLFYAVSIWSDPIAANRLQDGHLMLELRRMAIADDAPHNTASRFIKVCTRLIVRKYPELIKLVSYQDTEVHHGTIYKASGWVQETTATLTNWNTVQRLRSTPQSTAPKIRWAKELKKCNTARAMIGTATTTQKSEQPLRPLQGRLGI